MSFRRELKSLFLLLRVCLMGKEEALVALFICLRSRKFPFVRDSRPSPHCVGGVVRLRQCINLHQRNVRRTQPSHGSISVKNYKLFTRHCSLARSHSLGPPSIPPHCVSLNRGERKKKINGERVWMSCAVDVVGILCQECY